MASGTSTSSRKDVTKAKNFERGSYKPNEKPSDHAGIWKGKERTLNDIRRKAWTRK